MEETLRRLPPALRDLLAAHPAYAERIAKGLTLDQAAGSPDLPRQWTERADPVSRWLLRLIIRSYGCLPFEESALERLAIASSAGSGRDRPGRTDAPDGPDRPDGSGEGWTGAEIRVAVRGLLQAGILFAVRKAWGDRLLYLPGDRAPLWQLALFPMRPAPLPPERQSQACSDTAGSRLPLSLELFLALAEIRRGGLPVTAKGAPNKARIAKLAGAMRLTADEIRAADLAFARPEGVPEQAAFVLDAALRKRWLRRLPNRWEAAERPFGAGAPDEPDLPPSALDAELLDLVAAEYGGAEAALHFAATALRGLEPGVWYRERDTIPAEPFSGPSPELAAAHGRWLALTAALGWMERGTAGGEPVCRWLIDPRPMALQAGEPLDAGCLIVQPDGEIWAPAETGMAARWTLELLADRQTADQAMFIYRLTRESCLRAHEAGFTLRDALSWLEAQSGAPAPHAVRLSLADWFGRFGRLTLGEETLLRVDDAELAGKLAQDAALGPLLRERLAAGVFAVAAGKRDELARRLRELGYPPAAGAESATGPDNRAATPASQAATATGDGAPRGLSVYEPDDRIPAWEQLFPGLDSVPPAWLRQTGRYHVSTRRKLVERALAWRTSLQVKLEGEERLGLFVPETLEADGDGWRVAGRFRDGGVSGERLELAGDRLAELKIELPGEDREKKAGAGQRIDR
nr:helicase-associated domain-containing protein [Cohnella zeiphila]